MEVQFDNSNIFPDCNRLYFDIAQTICNYRDHSKLLILQYLYKPLFYILLVTISVIPSVNAIKLLHYLRLRFVFIVCV